MSDLLLEIGAENIPAFYIEPAVTQLRGDLERWLTESRLRYDEVYATGTPRRLTAIVRGLAAKQEAAEELVTGPPVSKAWDEDGKPTKAVEGFARSQGVGVDELERVETPKGEYVGVRRTLECARTADMLRDHLADVVAGIRFPKAMKWEPSKARFARPVRWIVCLLGTKPVKFEFAGVESGNRTWFRPWMRRESAAVRSASAYGDAMKKLGVIVDAAERRERIRRLAQAAADKLDLKFVEDENLITELTYMVEDPRAIVGEFSREYLELPKEVVTTAMRSHQRYIALVDERGKLAARFITFTDGRVSSPAVVRDGNEKVLRARLEDASFYWKEDVRRGVESLSDELDRIVFIEGWGTVGEKWRRIERLGRLVNERLTRREPAPPELVARAARLAKADLASEMVKDGKEFTKLQGLIGSHYAREAGEDKAVVAAVREHYLPRNPGDRVPRTSLGAVIGVADRVDTICGCFLAGFKPTGSQDPYALRRLANGAIRILREEDAVRLDELVDAGVQGYADGGYADAEAAAEAREALSEFFRQRCEAFLRENGVAYDVANAVQSVAWASPGVALARARDIAGLRGDAAFERLITGVKRVGNILKGGVGPVGADWEWLRGAIDGRASDGGRVFDPTLFDAAAETGLLDAIRQAAPRLEAAEAEGRFAGVLAELSGLADPIDAYFDAVLVNAEDKTVRNNRHGFLGVVHALFARYADFSAIVENGETD